MSGESTLFNLHFAPSPAAFRSDVLTTHWETASGRQVATLERLSIAFKPNANGKNTAWWWVSRYFSRLPFSTRRSLFWRLLTTRVFDSFCYNYQPVLKSSYVSFSFFFYSNRPVNGHCLHKGKKKVRASELMFVRITFTKAINCFMWNAIKLNIPMKSHSTGH